MMLTHTEAVKPDLISEHRFRDDLAKHLGMRPRLTRVVEGDVAERVEAELNR